MNLYIKKGFTLVFNHCESFYIPILYLYVVFTISKEHQPEQHSGKCQRTPQPCVEHSNEYIRHKPGAAKPDSAAHHYRHDTVRLKIEEMPYRAELFFIALDPLGMLDAHFIKHHSKRSKNKNG